MMDAQQDLSVEERILLLLRHLGIEKAHFAARMPSDWTGLAVEHPDVISSLTLVCPPGINVDALSRITTESLVFAGDSGRGSEAVQRAVTSLPNAKLVSLGDYFSPAWADVVVDHQEDIGLAMMEFLQRQERTRGDKAALPSEGDGEVAGITYSIRGNGPPLILLPLILAPSQWDPLLPELMKSHCTIVLGGAELGAVAGFEGRDRAAGFLGMVRGLMEEADLRPGEAVLDVGCGTGALDRWLAHRTNGVNPIVGIDLSRYLIGEAKSLVRNDGLEGIIDFREGNAEALPFPDESFEMTMSITVMEEVDADLAMAELVRVTKPGGRIAAIVHAMDMPGYVNLPLRRELKAKVESPGAYTLIAEEQGCADAGLYRRFREAGLVDVRMLPQLAPFDSSSPARLQSRQAQVLAILSGEEGREWQVAATEAQAEGNFIIAEPYHCAIGTKP